MAINNAIAAEIYAASCGSRLAFLSAETLFPLDGRRWLLFCDGVYSVTFFGSFFWPNYPLVSVTSRFLGFFFFSFVCSQSRFLLRDSVFEESIRIFLLITGSFFFVITLIHCISFEETVCNIRCLRDNEENRWRFFNVKNYNVFLLCFCFHWIDHFP